MHWLNRNGRHAYAFTDVPNQGAGDYVIAMAHTVPINNQPPAPLQAEWAHDSHPILLANSFPYTDPAHPNIAIHFHHAFGAITEVATGTAIPRSEWPAFTTPPLQTHLA
ncbi:MAG: hypothetical protein ACKPKO_64195, partial [Candidatus Fonsibacter sp.]